ncbi:MAG: DNA-binding protein WhiA [Clostridia bacterium]|nr:DNA-binding protein WhiA [Clostridia bacterium]
MSRLSFAARAKREICENPLAQNLPEVELAAMTLAGASLQNDGSLRYRTESPLVASRIAGCIERVSSLQAEIAGSATRTVQVRDGAGLLSALGLSAEHQDQMPAGALNTRRGRIASLRGAFLACGTISDPKKGYHLEFVTPNGAFARLLQDTLRRVGISAKISQRRTLFVLYLNEGDSVASLLALIGAHTSILNLENVRIFKETRNNVNRAVNCETANINKAVNAALVQRRSIELIDREMGLGKLSASLQEAARLRLQYPEATLQELCELSGTTKSGMNHRLRKINAIARDISGEEL